MPNPLPGDGNLTAPLIGGVGQGQVLPIGNIYLAAYNATTPVAAPGAKLGTSEPASAYVRVGLLQDDMFNITETDPGVIEYRRGFRQRYYGEVINKTGDKTITAMVVEPEVAIVSSFTGDNADAVTGGHKLDLRAGTYYDKTMLIVYQDAQSGMEFQMYNPHVRARYKFNKGGGGGGNAQFLTLDLTLKLITFVNSGGLYVDVSYYEFS